MEKEYRTHSVTFKTTKSERDHWFKKAREEGNTLSNKLRMMLVEAYGLPREKQQ